MNSRREVRALRAVVSGRVQGVAFRWSTQEKAGELGVHGWVRNRLNGSVECWLEAEPEVLDSMLKWLQRGPRMARIDGVQRWDEEPQGEDDFRVLPTTV